MKKWNFIFFVSSVSFVCSFSFVGCTPSKPDARFYEAYNIVKKEYIKPVSDQELTDNAIKGMLEGLDQHSTYLNKNEWEQFKAMTRGEYAGIGIEVMPQKNSLQVVSLLDKGPAKKAGILVGDRIIESNHQTFEKMNFIEMIQSLRGPVGSPVDITVTRSNTHKFLYFHVIRQKLDLQTIASKLYPHGIGYIRLALFEENAAKDIQTNLENLQIENHGPLKGLIIDVRNNPGGLLESAAEVTDLFLDYREMGPNHMIVYSKNRQGVVTYEAKADDKDIFDHRPLVILINKGSASGAEILAAALHEHRRATLVGSRTFGKGSVQTVTPLDNDGAIKFTIGLYYTPNGQSIDKIGIAPDIEVNAIPNNKIDEVLNKALTLF